MDDAEACLDFVNGISDQTKYLRFGVSKETSGIESTRYFCNVDYTSTFALVAEASQDGRNKVAAIARYYKLPGKNSAEIFILV